MNEKENEASRPSSDDFSVKSSKKMNIIAYIVCLLLAVVLWLIIMNVTEPAGNHVTNEKQVAFLTEAQRI